MSPLRSHRVASVDELRRAFDEAFAAPPVSRDDDDVQEYLAVEVAAHPFALRLEQVSSVHVDQAITSVPRADPVLLGLAFLDDAAIPVFDLGMLLGYPRRAAPRWLVRLAHDPVALAVDGFEGRLRLPGAATIAPEQTNTRPYLCGAVTHRDRLRPIVDVPAIVRGIRDRVRPGE